MNKRVIYATTNPSKTQHMKNLLMHLPVDIQNLADIGINTQVHENGNTPSENARLKVDFAFQQCGIPSFAVDSGLCIETFPKDKQPGLFVRRIYGSTQIVTDDEMLRYYQQELEKVGGQSKGTWLTAIALRIDIAQVYCETFISETLFTSKASHVIMKGEPLNSLQIDPNSGAYFSEMSPGERIKAQGERALGIIWFMERHWEEL